MAFSVKGQWANNKNRRSLARYGTAQNAGATINTIERGSALPIVLKNK